MSTPVRSHPPQQERRSVTAAVAVAFATLMLLIAPAVGSARAHAPRSGATAGWTGPASLALTGEPAAARSSGGYRFGSAPAVTSVSTSPQGPATTGPPPPPTGGKGRLCQFEWCQKLIEHLCHRIDCAKLAAAFRGTAKGIGRRILRIFKDPAFEKPWDGRGFDAHHIVAQNDRIYGGVARFAQSLLERVGIKADDPDNLAALRGTERETGKPGYDRLPRDLQERMAHADTTFRYYYERVNARFAEWIRSHGGRFPNEAEVRAILRSIKQDLYSGGKGFIKPGATPRTADVGAG